MAERFEYRFEWDARKARTNLKQHGVAFERAATVFSDKRAMSEYDSEHSEIEIDGLRWDWTIQASCL